MSIFLVFEGIDGSGKSTQARLLEKYLREERGIDCVNVREPGGTSLGEKVRDLVLHYRDEDLSPETELFLFMAARSHLTQTKIVPALQARRAVISDRYIWSSIVYQGVAAGIMPQEILRIGRLALHGASVTKTFVIDMDPEEAFQRVKNPNRMEDRGIDFQRRVRDGFLSLAEKFKAKAAVIDGPGTPEAVHARVLANLPTYGWSRCSSL